MHLFRPLCCLYLALLLGGCATMDKSECQNADWKTIGLEDGAAGRQLAYVGNHRKACAEYGVKPNLDAYREGHAHGARQFCTPANGFRQGRAGRNYSGICPADLEAEFLAAHATGRHLHDLSSEIDHLQRDARKIDQNRAELAERSDNIETLLVAGGLSTVDRKSLLDEFRQLQADIVLMDADIRAFSLEAARLQGEYDLLDSSHGY